MSEPRQVIGEAPRFIVHRSCVRPGEVVLGRLQHARRRQCDRCQASIATGLVVQAPAPLESYRRHGAR